MNGELENHVKNPWLGFCCFHRSFLQANFISVLEIKDLRRYERGLTVVWFYNKFDFNIVLAAMSEAFWRLNANKCSILFLETHQGLEGDHPSSKVWSYNDSDDDFVMT